MHDQRHEHYYTAHPSSLRQPVIYEDTLRGLSFRFWTDHGVFSRGHTDLGTEELVQAMQLDGAQRILDLGCGYGVIGIVAARLAPAAQVVMTDPNERAVELARQNIQVNGVHNAEVRTGEGYAPVSGERFDIILTNPPIRAGNAVIFALIDDALAHLTPHGRCYLVARTKQGAKTFARRWKPISLTLPRSDRGSGYRVFMGEVSSEQ